MEGELLSDFKVRRFVKTGRKAGGLAGFRLKACRNDGLGTPDLCIEILTHDT